MNLDIHLYTWSHSKKLDNKTHKNHEWFLSQDRLLLLKHLEGILGLFLNSVEV
jgi:hypothetical protein